MKRIIAVVLAVGTAGLLAGQPGHAAATTRPAAAFTGTATPEEAGWAVTGARFRFLRDTFVLPDAGRFAGQVGAFGVSLQLWSAGRVEVLWISTCATSTCTLSGTPAHNVPWNAAAAEFDPATSVLLRSDGAGPAMAAGDTVTEELYYNRAAGKVNFTVLDATAGTAFRTSLLVGPSETFRVGRVGAEFATDPFSGAPYSAPGSVRRLVHITGVRVTDYAVQRGGIGSAHWGSGKLTWTRTATGAVNANASNLVGSSFWVRLQP
jgi:hypothetical protein